MEAQTVARTSSASRLRAFRIVAWVFGGLSLLFTVPFNGSGSVHVQSRTGGAPAACHCRGRCRRWWRFVVVYPNAPSAPDRAWGWVAISWGIAVALVERITPDAEVI
jgi:hypothetical protein